MKFGCTNNPTLVSFQGIYKKILSGITNIVVKGSNVVLQDESDMVGVTPILKDKLEIVAEKFDISGDIHYENLLDLSLFKENVVDYMSGYVVLRVVAKSDCEFCNMALKTEPNNQMSLISLRDFGGKLVYPSDFVNKLMTLSEKIVSQELKGNVLSKGFSFDKIVLKIISDFVNLNQSVVDKLDEHRYSLCKSLVSLYVCIRLKHHAKVTSIELRNNNLRRKLNRICVNQKL